VVAITAPNFTERNALNCCRKRSPVGADTGQREGSDRFFHSPIKLRVSSSSSVCQTTAKILVGFRNSKTHPQHPPQHLRLDPHPPSTPRPVPKVNTTVYNSADNSHPAILLLKPVCLNLIPQITFPSASYQPTTPQTQHNSHRLRFILFGSTAHPALVRPRHHSTRWRGQVPRQRNGQGLGSRPRWEEGAITRLDILICLTAMETQQVSIDSLQDTAQAEDHLCMNKTVVSINSRIGRRGRRISDGLRGRNRRFSDRNQRSSAIAEAKARSWRSEGDRSVNCSGWRSRLHT